MTTPPSIDSLNEAFAIPGVAAFEAGPGGLLRAALTPPTAEAQVYLHGAQVAHHQPAGEPPLLFLSSRSRFAAGAAIRGGVPVVFPWFGARVGHPEAALIAVSATSSDPRQIVVRRSFHNKELLTP